MEVAKDTASNFVFDQMSEAYDKEFSDTAIGKAQRSIVWKYLSDQNIVRVGHSCLEMNAGTGIDAAHLAQFGMNVTATDKSAGMTAFLKQRGEKHNFQSSNASFDELRSKFSSKSFDLLFSNFGGLNCVDELELKQLLADFSNLTKPQGRLVIVLMSKSCLWERFYFTAKFRFRKAWRRYKKGGVPFHVLGHSLQIHYFNPNKVSELADSSWELLNIKPVGTFIPPSYLDNFFQNRMNWLNTLIRWEKRWADKLPAKWADHYILDFQRTA